MIIDKSLIGRMVWFWYAEESGRHPMAAVVNAVSDYGRISISVFEHTGGLSPRYDVLLVNDGEARPTDRDFCELRPQ